MSSASVTSPSASSSAATSSKPPRRDAMSPLSSGCALEGGDEADHVGVALRRDHDDLQLLGREAEGLRAERARRRPRLASSGDTGRPKTSREVTTTNATGWIGTRVPGGRTGRCTPFSPPSVDEGAERRRSCRTRLVDRALVADGQRVADLGDHHAGLPGRHLHPREAADTENIGQSWNRRPGISSSAW